MKGKLIMEIPVELHPTGCWAKKKGGSRCGPPLVKLLIAGVMGRGYYTQTVRDKVTPAVTRPFLRHHKADWTAR